MYCAGSYANNTLKKSDLTFKDEVVGVSFLGVCWARKRAIHLGKKQRYITLLFNF